jgi:hypothetical protein
MTAFAASRRVVHPMKAYTGPPATLGSTAKAYVRLIVWCDACKHQVDPDVAALAEKHGAETQHQGRSLG